MVIGSDDIMPTNTFKEYLKHKDNHDYLGVTKVYYVGMGGELHLKSYELNSSIIIGAGRTFSTELLYKVKRHRSLWVTPKNKSLDAMMYNQLCHYITNPKVIDGYIVDFKGEVNITQLSDWADELDEVDTNTILNFISEDELNLIKSL